MGASNRWSNCQRTQQSTGWDSNPRFRITGAESSPLDDQCLSLSVGPEGLEPSPTWLRARHAAANTLIPFRFSSSFFFLFCVHHPRGGNRTLDLILIRDLLQPLSYARSVGPKGVEPLPFRLKGGSATVTLRPQISGEAYAFESRACCQRRISILEVVFSVVVLRIELSATRISAGFGQPALDYQVLSRDGRNRTDTIVFPKHVGLPLPNIPLLFVSSSVARMGVEPISPP